MELFHENGHLTDEGLRAVIEEALDEMARLEAAEHLGFCDKCLVRYTALLTDDVLIAPEEPLAESVLARLKRKARRILWSRYGTVAAAACLAVTMWGVGSLALPTIQANLAAREEANVQAEADLPAGHEPGTGLDERLGSILSNTTNGLGSFFSSLMPAANPTNGASQAPETPTSRELERQQEEEKRQREEHKNAFSQNSKPDSQSQPNSQSQGTQQDDDKTDDKGGDSQPS